MSIANFFKKVAHRFKEGMRYNPSGHEEFMYDEFLSGIERYGYLEYVPEDEMEEAKKQLAQQSWPFYDDRSRRQYHADAENLAEKGGAEFIEEIRPFLEKQGVKISSIEEFFDEEYRITVNGKETVIWSREEVEAENAGKPISTWGLSTVRIFAVVNELLEQAGSKESLYAVSGGNDLEAFFLTPELADFICGSPRVMTEDLPYIPVAEHPWYGQPHSPD